MTVPQFNRLTSRQKKITVLRTGSFLGEHKAGIFRKMLYQVDNFYVEIFFLRFGREAIWYNTFEDTQGLRAYLKQIDISGVLADLSVSSNKSRQ